VLSLVKLFRAAARRLGDAVQYAADTAHRLQIRPEVGPVHRLRVLRSSSCCSIPACSRASPACTGRALSAPILLDYIIAFSVLGLAGIYGRGLLAASWLGIVTCRRAALRISHVAFRRHHLLRLRLRFQQLPVQSRSSSRAAWCMYSVGLQRHVSCCPTSRSALSRRALLYRPLRRFLEKK
jgi:hypothetical protein